LEILFPPHFTPSPLAFLLKKTPFYLPLGPKDNGNSFHSFRFQRGSMKRLTFGVLHLSAAQPFLPHSLFPLLDQRPPDTPGFSSDLFCPAVGNPLFGFPNFVIEGFVGPAVLQCISVTNTPAVCTISPIFRTGRRFFDRQSSHFPPPMPRLFPPPPPPPFPPKPFSPESMYSPLAAGCLPYVLTIFNFFNNHSLHVLTIAHLVCRP